MKNTVTTRIIMIDNFDSFSYNLVDLLRSEGHDVKVLRNLIELEELKRIIGDNFQSTLLVLSPGPGTPAKAGNLMQIIDYYHKKVPMLGICLGHQGIIEYLGGKVIISEETVHGKVSEITLSNHALFTGMTKTMAIGRYHSLQGTDLPNDLEVLAQFNSIPMIVYHESSKMLGLQFHPESILTPMGAKILNNAIDVLGVNA
jgi:anthranilate synthase component 2